MKYFSVLLHLSLCMVSCKNDAGKSNAENQGEMNDSSIIYSSKAIDSFYLKILTGTCDTLYGNAYTDDNTIVHQLSEESDSKYLLFESRLVCGAAMGTCGSDVNVFFEKDKVYIHKFNACGLNLKLLDEVNHSVKSFTYETRQGYLVKVTFNGTDFKEKSISLNGMNYEHLKVIAEKTNRKVEDFSIFGSGNSGIGLEILPIELGKGGKGLAYLMKSEYENCFVFMESELIFFRNNIQSIRSIRGEPDGYSKLEAISSDHYYQGIDTSYQIPLYFIFDERSNKYVRAIEY